MNRADKRRQTRCGKRGHWQAVDSTTGAVVEHDCIYCGASAEQATRVGQAMFKAVVLCALLQITVLAMGIVYMLGVGQ